MPKKKKLNIGIKRKKGRPKSGGAASSSTPYKETIAKKDKKTIDVIAAKETIIAKKDKEKRTPASALALASASAWA